MFSEAYRLLLMCVNFCSLSKCLRLLQSIVQSFCQLLSRRSDLKPLMLMVGTSLLTSGLICTFKLIMRACQSNTLLLDRVQRKPENAHTWKLSPKSTFFSRQRNDHPRDPDSKKARLGFGGRIVPSLWHIPELWFERVARHLTSQELHGVQSVCRGWLVATHSSIKLLGPTWFPTPNMVRTSLQQDSYLSLKRSPVTLLKW